MNNTVKLKKSAKFINQNSSFKMKLNSEKSSVNIEIKENELSDLIQFFEQKLVELNDIIVCHGTNSRRVFTNNSSFCIKNENIDSFCKNLKQVSDMFKSANR